MARQLKLGLAVAALVIAGAVLLISGTGEPQGADPGDADQVAVGRVLYADHCGACHGARLEGQPGWRTPLPTGGFPAPPHDESGHTWHHADQVLFDYTKHGGQAMVGTSAQSNMPGFAETLSDTEIWAVLAFIKSRWPAAVRERQATLNK